MDSRRKILIIVFSNLRHDARVKRQLNFLAEDYWLTVLCFDADEIPGVDIIRIKQTPLTFLRKAISGLFLLIGFYNIGHRWLHSYGYLEAEFKNSGFDLIIANDVETLPLAFQLSKDSGNVLFDAHEYAPRQFEDKLWWRIFFKRLNYYLCRKYLPQVKAMTTVGEGLAKEYEKEFGLKPIVITNATYYHDLSPTEVLRDRIKLVYHGIANPSRKIELMIEMMQYLDSRFGLDLILMTSDFASSKTKRYIENLKHLIQSDTRIRMLPQLPSDEVVPFINQYDIGIFLIPPVNFNYANTLPNKLFEYIQARIGIAVGPTPEMAKIVLTYGNGVVSQDFSAHSLAQKLKSLSRDSIEGFKAKSSVAAKDLSAENNKSLLLNLVKKTIASE